jgi:nucleoside-triphosphatase THEP1
LSDNKVYIIIGKQGSGKTKFLKRLVIELSKSDVDVGGFISEGLWQDNKRTGFILTTLKDSQQLELCTGVNKSDYLSFGRFWFNPEAIRFGNEVIKKDSLVTDIMGIDEIGIFELQEEIWYHSFMYLLTKTSKPVIITVREKILKDVIDKFGLKNVTIFNYEDNICECADLMLSNLSLSKDL